MSLLILGIFLGSAFQVLANHDPANPVFCGDGVYETSEQNQNTGFYCPTDNRAFRNCSNGNGSWNEGESCLTPINVKGVCSFAGCRPFLEEFQNRLPATITTDKREYRSGEAVTVTAYDPGLLTAPNISSRAFLKRVNPDGSKTYLVKFCGGKCDGTDAFPGGGHEKWEGLVNEHPGVLNAKSPFVFESRMYGPNPTTISYPPDFLYTSSFAVREAGTYTVEFVSVYGKWVESQPFTVGGEQYLAVVPSNIALLPDQETEVKAFWVSVGPNGKRDAVEGSMNLYFDKNGKVVGLEKTDDQIREAASVTWTLNGQSDAEIVSQNSTTLRLRPLPKGNSIDPVKGVISKAVKAVERTATGTGTSGTSTSFIFPLAYAQEDPPPQAEANVIHPWINEVYVSAFENFNNVEFIKRGQQDVNGLVIIDNTVPTDQLKNKILASAEVAPKEIAPQLVERGTVLYVRSYDIDDRAKTIDTGDTTDEPIGGDNSGSPLEIGRAHV